MLCGAEAERGAGLSCQLYTELAGNFESKTDSLSRQNSVAGNRGGYQEALSGPRHLQTPPDSTEELTHLTERHGDWCYAEKKYGERKWEV